MSTPAQFARLQMPAPFDHYAMGPAYDEMFRANGRPRTHYKNLHTQLMHLPSEDPAGPARDLLGAAGEQEDFRSIFARAAQGLQMGCDSAGPEKIRRKPSWSPAAPRRSRPANRNVPGTD